MPLPETFEGKDIRVTVDGVTLLTATDFNINSDKTINRTDLLSTTEQHVSEGNLNFSGSITGLKTNSAGKRFLHSRDQNSIDYQSLVWDGTTDQEVGTAVVQQSLNSVTSTYDQKVTALGTAIGEINLLLKRDAAFTEDLTILVRNAGDTATLGTITVPNKLIGTDKAWSSVFLKSDERVTGLTTGSKYILRFSVPGGTAGQVDFYGADVQSEFTVGTGDGIATAFDLNHSTVIESTLIVAVDGKIVQEYTFGDGTGTLGVDQIVFATAPASGAVITALYEYDDNTDDFLKWNVAFTNTSEPTYEIVVKYLNPDGVVVDGRKYIDVRFSSAGTSATPGETVTDSLDWDARADEELL